MSEIDQRLKRHLRFVCIAVHFVINNRPNKQVTQGSLDLAYATTIGPIIGLSLENYLGN